MHRIGPRLVHALIPALIVAAAACGDGPTEPAGPPSDAAPQPVVAQAPHGVGTAASLQAALDDAAASPLPATVDLQPGAHIALDQALVYSGAQRLRIRGRGATLVGPDAGNAFEATGGGDLRIENLTVEGAAEHGIYAVVPAGRDGIVSVRLDGVTLADNGFAGLWLDDQVHDSPASVKLTIRDSRVVGNNTAGVGEGTDLADLADKDGVRVNEGGLGDLVLEVHGSHFEGNEADGLELDETGPGSAFSTVRHSRFIDNGPQRQFPADVEDGFDIDEAGEGSIVARFANVVVSGNQDEGIDLDEAGSGDVELEMIRVEASDNTDENVAAGEEDDGSILASAVDLTAERSVGGDGMQLEESDAGDVFATLAASLIAGNDDDGIQIDQGNAGGGRLALRAVRFVENGDDDINSEVEVVRTP